MSVLRTIASYSASAALCAVLACVAVAQEAPAVKAFHPSGPLPSYDVATIKPGDPENGSSGMTLRNYIAMAYGVPVPWGIPGAHYEGLQVLGGPDWIDKDRYAIDGKAPDELRVAMKNMSPEDRRAQQQMLKQSLLAERFRLKVHFETHEMAVFELLPAKGGLKITAVDPPPSGDIPKPSKPGQYRPGTVSLSVGNTGLNIINARSATMEQLMDVIRGQAPEIGGRPVANMTGFTGNFDVKDFRFAGLAYTHGPPSASATEPDAPSLSQALEQQLGIKVVRARAPVEVVVIDSIDRPTEN